MLLHGPTWTNSPNAILGLFGLGSNTILLRSRPATAPPGRGPVHIGISGEGRYPSAININPALQLQLPEHQAVQSRISGQR